jgi:formylglycine-generating enzyme required for sulfatase activity
MQREKQFLCKSWKLFSVVLLGGCLLVAEVPGGWPFDAKEAAKRQADAAKEFGVPKQLSVDLGQGLPLKLILIPPGKFMMGSPETETSDWPTAGARRTNERLHEVSITRPFYKSVYKVTQEQYMQILGTNPSQFPGQAHPVDAVTWDDAVRFCERSSSKTNRKIHLPTEAQWGYAARAGTATRYFFGDDEAKIPDFMWYRENSTGKTHPVGQKPPNAWGLFDVHGLLWEYCSDFFADSFGDEKNDPMGPAAGTTHSTRGGTYGSRPPFVRSAIRVASPADNATKEVLGHFGFRVAMELESGQRLP